MLRQSTESFFRLEFFKTPHILDDNGEIIGYEAPNRINRKLVFTKNLSLPLGEKVFYTGENFNEYIHVPVFMGSNYKNKENMYFFWFQDESVLTETTLSGTTTGNTFFMTAKFFNATDGSITDFTNDAFSDSYTATGITESTDMYYQVDIDKIDYSYKVYLFNGTKSVDRYGRTCLPIQFYERGGGTFTKPTYDCTSFVPPPTPAPSQTPAATPALTPPATPAPSQTPAAPSSSIFTATINKTQIGEQPPLNVVTVTVSTSQSMVGTLIWWGRHDGTAQLQDFINYDAYIPMTIQNATGHTFDLIARDDVSENEGDQTFSVAILTGTLTTPGAEVAYTPTFTILDDSIEAQYRYILLEAFLDATSGCTIPYSENNFKYYWDQEGTRQLDGSDVLRGGVYCFKFVSPTNNPNDLVGKQLISDVSFNDCPNDCSG
jgi:hypothetical protein